MGKFNGGVYRKDSLQDHVHRLPSGELTGGMLAKPSKDQYGMHTHLYECDERTCETTPTHDLPGHVHETELGETSGPQAYSKEPGEPWKKETA